MNDANEDSNKSVSVQSVEKSACVQFESVCVQMNKNINARVQVNENSKYISKIGAMCEVKSKESE